MLSIKSLLPLVLVILPFSLAQKVLSPPDCALQCVKLSLSASTCAEAEDGLNDPSAVPCLCEDIPFMRETVDCIINSGECRSIADQQASFAYAVGLCDSIGVKYQSDLPAEFGLSLTATRSATTPGTTKPIVATMTIEETLTSTRIEVKTSVCSTPSFVNATYTVVVRGNVTQTLFPQPTSYCGNYTSTSKVVTTRKSTRTTTATPRLTEIMNTERIEPTSTSMAGAEGQNVQTGFMLAFMGALMWLV